MKNAIIGVCLLAGATVGATEWTAEKVRALAYGNWIFVKHLSLPDSYNDNKRIGEIAYLSRDEGRTWEGGLVLDARKSVTYPDVEQGPDGLIYVTHDFERGREAEIILHRFTEEDILAKRFQSPKSRTFSHLSD